MGIIDFYKMSTSAQNTMSPRGNRSGPGADFNCSLDGFKKLTDKAFNAILTPLNLLVRLAPLLFQKAGELAGPSVGGALKDLRVAFDLFYDYFALTLPGSLGFLVAAVFYLAKYLNYGQEMCDASSYLYLAIYYADYLNELLAQFGGDDGTTGTS